MKACRFVSSFARPLILGFLIQAEEDFSSLENSNVFVSIGSLPNLTFHTTMKNQDKKNGPAKQSGNTSNPRNTPGQPEAGPEGAQGRPSQSTPATEAEGSTSQAAGKAEGACASSAFPARRGRSLWRAGLASGIRGPGHCLPSREEMWRGGQRCVCAAPIRRWGVDRAYHAKPTGRPLTGLSQVEVGSQMRLPTSKSRLETPHSPVGN